MPWSKLRKLLAEEMAAKYHFVGQEQYAELDSFEMPGFLSEFAAARDGYCLYHNHGGWSSEISNHKRDRLFQRWRQYMVGDGPRENLVLKDIAQDREFALQMTIVDLRARNSREDWGGWVH
jgi:hypothetical protein